jgi:hypothetical protein
VRGERAELRAGVGPQTVPLRRRLSLPALLVEMVETTL